MVRKRRFSKLLLFAAMISTIGAGVLGSVPIPVKAAEEEETYTVTFKAYEGNCDTESLSVPKGESIILPDGYYEGHYLESWMDITDTVTEEGTVTKFTAVGRPGSSYTPERSLWLHANWKPDQEQDITVTYEARIGDASYEELEEAFANAQAGDTITVLKDCSVSATLEVTADNITLKSEDAGNPVTISREDDFAGKSYGMDTDTVLLAVTGGSLTTQDIIFDGGAVFDDDFNNSGKVWNSPLIYVDGSYAMEGGTVLQNNYNTDGYESTGSGRPLHTAGAVQIKSGGSFTMDNGLIQNCYTSGGGGGIQSERESRVTAASSIVTNCHATWGGGMELYGEAELTGMTITENAASSTGGGISSISPLTVTDSLFEGNASAYDGGGICTKTGHKAELIGCTFTGNRAPRGCAIQTFKGEGELPLVIRNCTITGNRSGEKIHAGGTICYMNETGIILSGKIVMEDNLAAGYEPCDIHYFYNTGASILLDEDFESDSIFVLGGYDEIKPGRVLIDGTLYHKDASPEQFPWHCPNYCTVKKGENLYLAEAPKTYFVRYNANNNPTGESVAVSDPDRYTSDDTAVIMYREALYSIMGHFINPGYDLVGWNTEPDGSGIDYVEGQEVNLTEDLYLYAKWEVKKPVTVTITYIYNNGTEDGTDSAKVVPGASIVFPDASRKGYSFKGWYEDEELTVFAGNAGEEYSAPEKDTVYYAAWEKAEATITFDADGGEMEGGDVTAKIGDTITLPNCTKDDYEFIGWYDGDICVGQAREEYTVSDDVTLKAHYEKKEAADCTITFDADGGKMEGGDITAKEGDTITLPNCTKADYTFVGWYDGDTCIGQAGEEYTVSADVTLKAHYEKKEAVICTVTFDADGGKMEGGNIAAKVGDTITLPACTKDGYEFIGWYDGNTCAGKAGEDYTVSADVTLKAHYEKKEDETIICTVTFDADGGDIARKSIEAEKGSTIILPACSKTGYEFLGWFLASDDNICIGQAGEEFTVQGDISLKAHFEKKEAEKVMITFDADGGKAVKPIKTSKGDTIRLPKTEKEGYSFLGWYTEKDGGILLGIPGSEMKAVKDMTAYALWEKEAEKDSDNDADTETCKVTFHAGKGTIKTKELTIIKDGSLYLPMPEREGYDFTGWYLDDDLTQFAGAYHDTYRITRDTDFYAKWEKSRDSSDGSNTGNNGGTGDNGNTGNEEDNTQDGDNSGETLNTYTIKYDANGGKTKNASVKVVKGGSVKLPVAEREGYIFKGWHTDRQVFIGTEGETYKPSRSISLYARWEKEDKDSQDNDTENTNDKDNKNTSDKNTNTNGTVSGNSVNSPSDKNTGNKMEGGNGNAGKGTEPVIQTGHASPFTLLAALGLCGILLAAASVLEGKKEERCSL